MKTVFTGVLLLLSCWLSAQPINDNCATATSIIIPCSTPVNGSIAGATQSDSAINCNGFTSLFAGDVWYQFTATAGITYNIAVAPSAGIDAVVDLRSGTCGSQTSVACADDYYAGYTENLVFAAPSTGTYYVRVYHYRFTSTDTASTSTFTICAAVVGINEQDGQIPFSVFPNPTKGNISISINKAMSDASLVIYNSLGAKTYSDKISGSGNRTLELKIDEPPGIYFLEIKDETNRFIQKIIMQANE